nr:chloride channel protein CLC-D [Ipomoea batatas]
MLSNHLQNGLETAKTMWSRLPAEEEEELEGLVPSKKMDDGSVESLDYEVIENYAYREQQAKKGKLYVGYSVVVKWLFALLTGIGTGLAAVFINISVENFAGWKYSLTFQIIQKSYFAGFLVYTLINVALVLSSVYIVTHFAPAAAGSGIPEIKGIDMHGILLFRTLIGKIFGSIGSVGGGLALGKEGPLVHTGACIASLLGQVTCGCAAGVAAAFRAPVGGVLFALEEVTSWWRSQLLWRVFFTSAIVAVVVRSAMGWCKSGKCGHFGSGGFIIWDISGGQDDYSVQELLPMAIIGVVGGLLVISFGLPLFRRCTPCPDFDANSGIECPRAPGMYGNYVNFYCKNKKEYNDLATLFFNTQDDAIRNLFSANTVHEFSAQSLLTFLVLGRCNTSPVLLFVNLKVSVSQVMFYTLAVMTFGTAVPAGQFVPGIMIGSTYGRLVGMFVVRFYRKLDIEEGTYALLGAASFLGGINAHDRVVSCVIMVEISNNLKIPASHHACSAHIKGLYEEQARLRSIPLLESRPKYQNAVIYFPRVVKVADTVSILQSNNHNGFPVIDHTKKWGDTSHWTHTTKVDFQHSPLPCNVRDGSIPIRHNLSEFVKPVSSKGISIGDIHLTQDDMEMYIDLAPFINPSPYIVPEDMSLTKVTSQVSMTQDNNESDPVELHSTSVSRGWAANKRVDTRIADVGQPLLDDGVL